MLHLILWFNKTVFTVFSFIYDIDCFRFRIEEYEEIVTDEIHLQNSFFYVHRTGSKFLDTGHFKRFFRHSFWCCCDEVFVERTFQIGRAHV